MSNPSSTPVLSPPSSSTPDSGFKKPILLSTVPLDFLERPQASTEFVEQLTQDSPPEEPRRYLCEFQRRYENHFDPDCSFSEIEAAIRFTIFVLVSVQKVEKGRIVDTLTGRKFNVGVE